MSAPVLPHIDVPQEAIRSFCQRHGVIRFSLFGSVLLQFAPGVRYRLVELVAMGDELEALFGRRVDIIDRAAVEQSQNFIRREAIFSSEQVIYAE